MRFYLKEITYKGKPLLWNTDEEHDIATSKEIVDPESQKTESIRPFINLVNKSNSISVLEHKFLIKGIAEYLEKNQFKPYFVEEEKSSEKKLSPTFFETPTRPVRSFSTPVKFAQPPNEKSTTLSREFCLEKMITVESGMWGETLTFLVMPEKTKKAVEQQKEIIFISDIQLLHIKDLENSYVAACSKQKTILILKEIIEKIFNKILKENLISDENYKQFSDAILSWISRVSSSKGLMNVLDHEELYDQSSMSALKKEDLEIIRLSQELEKARVYLIASDFAYENLPDYFKTNLKKMGLFDDYSTLYGKLCDNLLESGRIIRGNKKKFNDFKVKIRDPNYEGDYVSLTAILDKFLPKSFTQPQPLTRKSSLGKMNSANQPSESYLNILKVKIIEAFVKVYTDVKSKCFNPKASIARTNDMQQPFFIKKEFENSFVMLLESELKYVSNSTGDVKNLVSNIENLKISNLSKSIEGWLENVKLNLNTPQTLTK